MSQLIQDERRARRLARRRKRRKRRRAFLKKVGKGIKHVAGGLLCAGKVAISEVMSDPKLSAEFAALASAVYSGGLSEAATGGMGIAAVADIAKSLGTAVVNKCIKDPSKRSMAQSMIQVTDVMKYADIAYQKSPLEAVKAMAEDTHKNTQSVGHQLALRAGVNPEALKQDHKLVETLEKLGIDNASKLLNLSTSDKVKFAQNLISTLTRN